MVGTSEQTAELGFIQKLNGPWHERALWIYLAIVVLHWIEHLFQAAQIWIVEMPRPEALGALGYVFPWLVKSEVMHFGYALIMFTGLVLLLPGFRGAARGWWLASTIIQGWHLVEHSTLQIQAIVGTNLFGSPVPTSFLQPFIPRPELHLVYNLIVFIPMIVAMWLHTARSRMLSTIATAPPRRWSEPRRVWPASEDQAGCSARSAAARDRTSTKTSGGWAPLIPYRPSITKNGTPLIPYCRAWTMSTRTESEYSPASSERTTSSRSRPISAARSAKSSTRPTCRPSTK